jgi:hypothetical protein
MRGVTRFTHAICKRLLRKFFATALSRSPESEDLWMDLSEFFGVRLMRIIGGWVRRVGVGGLPCVASPREREEADEESDGGNGEHGNGAAETGAYLRGGAGGGVAAHATALCVGGERAG